MASNTNSIKKQRKYHQDHGLHNLEFCSLLYNDKRFKGKYNDWIVTSAFYSVIHAFEGFTIPFKYISPSGNKVEFESESGIVNEIKNLMGKKRDSRHNVRGVILQYTYGEKTRILYDKLNNYCFAARYKNYNINDTVADRSLNKWAAPLINTFRSSKAAIIKYSDLPIIR